MAHLGQAAQQQAQFILALVVRFHRQVPVGNAAGQRHRPVQRQRHLANHAARQAQRQQQQQRRHPCSHPQGFLAQCSPVGHDAVAQCFLQFDHVLLRLFVHLDCRQEFLLHDPVGLLGVAGRPQVRQLLVQGQHLGPGILDAAQLCTAFLRRQPCLQLPLHFAGAVGFRLRALHQHLDHVRLGGLCGRRHAADGQLRDPAPLFCQADALVIVDHLLANALVIFAQRIDQHAAQAQQCGNHHRQQHPDLLGHGKILDFHGANRLQPLQRRRRHGPRPSNRQQSIHPLTPPKRPINTGFDALQMALHRAGAPGQPARFAPAFFRLLRRSGQTFTMSACPPPI